MKMLKKSPKKPFFLQNALFETNFFFFFEKISVEIPYNLHVLIHI